MTGKNDLYGFPRNLLGGSALYPSQYSNKITPNRAWTELVSARWGTADRAERAQHQGLDRSINRSALATKRVLQSAGLIPRRRRRREPPERDGERGRGAAACMRAYRCGTEGRTSTMTGKEETPPHGGRISTSTPSANIRDNKQKCLPNYLLAKYTSTLISKKKIRSNA